MTELATNFVEYFKGKREAALETLVRITFGTFMGGLTVLTEPWPVKFSRNTKINLREQGFYQ